MSCIISLHGVRISDEQPVRIRAISVREVSRIGRRLSGADDGAVFSQGVLQGEDSGLWHRRHYYWSRDGSVPATYTALTERQRSRGSARVTVVKVALVACALPLLVNLGILTRLVPLMRVSGAVRRLTNFEAPKIEMPIKT